MRPVRHGGARVTQALNRPVKVGGRQRGRIDDITGQNNQHMQALRLAYAKSKQIRLPYMNPSSSRASSDIMSIPHGGSHVRSTSTCLTPGKGSIASATHPGISPATGQPGAVSVIMMLTSEASLMSIV